MKKRIFIVLILCYCSAWCQKNPRAKIDSLELVLNQEKNIDSILKLNNAIAIELKNKVSVEDAIDLLHKNVRLAKQHKNLFGAGDSYLILTQIYLTNSQLDSAEVYVSKSIDIFKTSDFKNKLARAYYLNSVIYQSQSDFTNQLKYTLLAVENAEKSKDYNMMSDSCNALAMYYLDQIKYEEALKYAKKSLEYATLSKNIQRIGTSYMGLAESYSLLNDTINANTYFQKSYELTKSNNQKYATAWNLTNWAKLKPDAEALKMRLEANDIWEEFGDIPMNVHNTGMIGVLYLKMYDTETDNVKKITYLKNAETYLTNTIEKADSNDDLINSMEFNKSLSHLYGIKKQYDKAYFYLEKSSKLNDSLNSQDIKNTLAKLESQKEIQLRDKEIQLNTVKLDIQKKQQFLYIGGISLLAIIGGLLFYQSRNRRKINKKLSLLNTELDQANKNKTRFFSILNHDLRSPVSNLIHFLHLQKNNPELLDEETKQRLENRTISGAENLLSSMEDILLWSKGQMENFAPQPKNIKVEELFIDNQKVFSGYQNISFIYENKEDISLFTDKDYLKTIIRNLTSNAINVFTNTSKPSIIWKAWKDEQNNTFLSITDNGPGATEKQFNALYDETQVVGIKSGLGLHLIRDLAKAIDCNIKVNSQIGKGTTITISF